MAGRERLGARRKALGLTQESLAERLRVERSTVASWEQGTSTPRPWYRRRLAEALDLTPDELAQMLSPLPESRAPARPCGSPTWSSTGEGSVPGWRRCSISGVPDPRVRGRVEPGSGLDLVGRPGGAQLAPGDDAAQPRRPGRRPRPVPYGLRAAGPGGEAVPVQRPGPPSRRAGVGRAWLDAVDSLDRLTAEVDGIRSGRTDALLRRVVRRIGDRRPPAPSAATNAAEHLTRRLDRAP
jgi:DNA-binding XRE family transcriptional regulator